MHCTVVSLTLCPCVRARPGAYDVVFRGALACHPAYYGIIFQAHSQLGDIHSDHAVKARQMAFVQQRIAIAMGNAGLAARCSMFVVWSDLQRGRYAEVSEERGGRVAASGVASGAV